MGGGFNAHIDHRLNGRLARYRQTGQGQGSWERYRRLYLRGRASLDRQDPNRRVRASQVTEEPATLTVTSEGRPRASALTKTRGFGGETFTSFDKKAAFLIASRALGPLTVRLRKLCGRAAARPPPGLRFPPL